MIFDLVKEGHEDTSLFPIHTYSSESYADSHYRLYLTDELEKDRTGHKSFITNYRLHAQQPHSIEMALAYDVHCPKCGRLMKQVGRSQSYHDLGLYTCKFCNEH